MKDKVKKVGARNPVKTDVISQCGGEEAGDVKHDEEASFSVKIQGAGVETFELQVLKFWRVQDVIMALLSRNEVCPRSNMSLTLAGSTLDPLSELQTIKGLKPGAVIRMVEEPYTAHSARHHVAGVVELLKASGPQDALREGRSPSVLETLTHTQSTESGLPNAKSLKRSSSNTKAESSNQEGAPPDYLLPGSSERPLMALLPHSSQTEVPSFLKDLTLSCWHPPPGHRKLQGDFMYITMVTTEGRRCDVTSCPKGFFMNRSTEDVFDPRPVQSSPAFHCFTDLLCHISPGFKQTFTTIKNRPQQQPLEAIPTPYQTLSWLGPPCASRTHKNNFSSLGVDEQAGIQAPDWNEELQAARDLPNRILEERLQRDKALLHVNSAFVRTVMQGAEVVIDGFAEPVNGNPADPAFLWGGVFLSQGATSTMFGGERGRRAAQRLELKGVQAYSDLEGMEELHTLPTAIVDYRGVRLSAQGLAPGLESSDQDQEASPASRGLLYGINAGAQESPQRRRLLALLAHAAKSLSLQRHVVVAPSGRQVPLFTSVDAQGLLGADKRFYLLDVFRTFPADANFCAESESSSHVSAGDEGSSKNCNEDKEENHCEVEGLPEDFPASSGLPKSFLHGLCRLRPELVKAFIQHKHCQFTQLVEEKMAKNGDLEESAETDGIKATDAVRAACKEVDSVSDIIFEMRFNPNIFSSGVNFPLTESAAVQQQKKLLKEAAVFIITHQIPAFLHDCLRSNEAPMDGVTLKQALHLRGINLRYLGHIVKAISQSENKELLRHILRSTIGEVYIRSARRVFNRFLQSVDIPSLSAAVSHFLNCLLVHHFTPSPIGEEAKKKSKRRGRGAGASENTPWSSLTGTELWNLVYQDAVETYDISDKLGSSPNYLVEHYGLQKLSLLREFCLKTGVQLRLRDYTLDSQNKAPIGPDDILNIFPVVKHLIMPTVDASRMYCAAQNSIQKGLLDQALEQLKEAAYLFGRVCDSLHPQACYCQSLLAKVMFLQGKAAEARSTQLKAVVISERVLGFDHPNTIQQYALLGVYVYAGGETTLAQKCLLRARLLLLTVHGEDHPYTAVLDSCLGLLLTEDQTGLFLKNALKLNISFFGNTDLSTALSQHLLAQWMCSKGDYRSAMTHEKEALSAYTELFGADHPQTSCSKEFLVTITNQAVKVERKLRQTGVEFVECMGPTSDTILEQMVLITGIRTIARSDRFQEYKQKHLELKAAVVKELGLKAPTKRVTSDLFSSREKSSNKGTGCGKETVDGGNDAVKNNGENQSEHQVGKVPPESGTSVLANGHVEETAKKNKYKEATNVNGDCGVTLGLENGEVNGDADAAQSPSALMGNLSWADVVSKSSNGVGGKAVNGLESVSSNGLAED